MLTTVCQHVFYDILLLVRHRPSADPPWMKKFCAVGELEKAIPFFFVVNAVLRQRWHYENSQNQGCQRQSAAFSPILSG
jgi:hypothetical protein